MLFIMLLVIALISAVASQIWVSNRQSASWYLGLQSNTYIYSNPVDTVLHFSNFSQFFHLNIFHWGKLMTMISNPMSVFIHIASAIATVYLQ